MFGDHLWPGTCSFVALEKEPGFLNEHITRWVTRFCDVMVKEARVELYRGIALMTKG